MWFRAKWAVFSWVDGHRVAATVIGLAYWAVLIPVLIAGSSFLGSFLLGPVIGVVLLTAPWAVLVAALIHGDLVRGPKIYDPRERARRRSRRAARIED